MLSFWYLARIKFEPELTISESKSIYKIFAETPTGGIIELSKEEKTGNFYYENRFLHEMFIICSTPNFEFKIITDGETIIIDETEFIQIQNGVYKFKPESYPPYNLKNKIIDLFKVNWNNILISPLKTKFSNTLKSNIFFFSVLCLIIFLSILKHKNKVLYLIKTPLQALKKLIIQEKAKVFIPYIISLVPSTLFLLLNKDYPEFIGISAFGAVLASTLILFPIIFAVYYNKSLKLNVRFFLTILIIFIMYCFVLYPQNYMYGIGFRDDISKFFVKAMHYDYAECLFQPNSGYLNVFQSGLACVLIKVFSFKNYFPEALQIITALLIAIIFASFNLKVFKQLVYSDNTRFLIVLIVSILLIGIPGSKFVFEIPFLAALLLWPTLFITHKLSKLAFSLLLLIIIVFVLSKPIFIIYAPALAIMLLYSIIKKDKNCIIFSSFILIGILVQVIVYFANPITTSLPEINNLGTYYENAFKVSDLGFLETIFYSFYLFIRISVSLTFPFLKDGLSQLILNAAFVLFWVIICIKLSWTYINKKKNIYLFLIVGLSLSLFSSFLFIKTANVADLQINNSAINSLKFADLLKSNYLVPYHRYLVLGLLPQLAVIAFIIIKLISRCNLITRHIIIVIFILFLFANRVNIITNYSQISSIKQNYAKPSSSLWRENSDLIFNYRNEFYIPYYGYPKQSECIKFNTDRITDITMNNSNSILITNLHPTAHKWDILQIITEYDEHSARIQYLIAITDKDSIRISPFNKISNKNRFIIFRLTDNTKLKEIIFVDNKDNYVKLKRPIRLVGEYE